MPFSDLISITRKLVSLSRTGSISAARHLFDQIPHKDTIAWNALLIAYSPLQALSLFPAMRSSAVRPDAFSFTALFAASADVPDLITGTKLRALILHLGFHSSLPVCNALIDMYGELDSGELSLLPHRQKHINNMCILSCHITNEKSKFLKIAGLTAMVKLM